MNALDTALHRIATECTGNRRQRLATDRRINALQSIIAAMDQPITYGGMLGALQVFASLSGAENVRIVRAGALIQARIHQIDGYRAGVKLKLARAAALRAQEIELNSNMQREAA
jgi:hypothetical protein